MRRAVVGREMVEEENAAGKLVRTRSGKKVPHWFPFASTDAKHTHTSTKSVAERHATHSGSFVYRGIARELSFRLTCSKLEACP